MAALLEDSEPEVRVRRAVLPAYWVLCLLAALLVHTTSAAHPANPIKQFVHRWSSAGESHAAATQHRVQLIRMFWMPGNCALSHGLWVELKGQASLFATTWYGAGAGLCASVCMEEGGRRRGPACAAARREHQAVTLRGSLPPNFTTRRRPTSRLRCTGRPTGCWRRCTTRCSAARVSPG